MSIRLRLTLLYSLILAATLVVFGVALYFTVARVTLNVVTRSLRNQAPPVVRIRPFRPGNFDFPPVRFAEPDTYMQVVAPDGEVIDRSSNLGTYRLPVSNATLQAGLNGRTHTRIAATDNGRLLLYSQPLVSDGRVVGLVQLGRSLVDYDQSLSTLRRILLIVGGVVTVGAFGVGWVLAGAGLQPIHRITQTAQAIGAQRDFERRVDYTGPADEVGELATTFNAMLSELEDSYRQLEVALQVQRRFVADASHELRTPLTTVRGNLELLRRQPPISAEDRAAVLTDVVEECDRLIRLVSDLLVLARADAGRPLHRERVSVKPLVEHVCRQAQLLGPDKVIDCAVVDDVDVLGDEDALKQVVLSLVDNALKYTPIGGTIALETNVDGDEVALSVRDTGPGIHPTARDHIFERFYQSDGARAGAGFGLGLAIAKALTEAQGGAICVESEIGTGSVFTVRLPQATDGSAA